MKKSERPDEIVHCANFIRDILVSKVGMDGSADPGDTDEFAYLCRDVAVFVGNRIAAFSELSKLEGTIPSVIYEDGDEMTTAIGMYHAIGAGVVKGILMAMTEHFPVEDRMDELLYATTTMITGIADGTGTDRDEFYSQVLGALIDITGDSDEW